MTLFPLDLHEAHTDPTEAWSRSIPRLRAEIASLTTLLTALTSEESEAQEQLESLTYALGLTKGELARRKRSNSELSRAYETGRGSFKKPDDLVQKLEGELLNAKRDSANVEFEVEALQFRLKRMTEGLREPASPVVTHSPRVLPSPALGGVRSPIASPQARVGRLIGDVDAVVGLLGEFVPCRVGVSAGGGLGIYTYDSAECLLWLEETVCKAEMGELETGALKEWLRCVEVVTADGGGVIVGLREGVQACAQVIREVGAGIDGG